MLSISVFKLIGNCLNFRFKVSDLPLASRDFSIVLRNFMGEFCNLLRNNRKLLARVKAFDRHMNMILENV